MKIKIKKLKVQAVLPTVGYQGDAGLDLYALEDYELKPGERHVFFVGLALEFPAGYVGFIKDRGSLPKNAGLHAIGGVFDSGYRGEYNVNLINLSQESYKIKVGDKIAQLVIMPFLQTELEEVDELSSSERGGGSFGSTGR